MIVMSNRRPWVRRSIYGVSGLAALVAVAAGALTAMGLPRIVAGMAAKGVCSAAFLAGRAPEHLLDEDVRPADAAFALVSAAVDTARRSVTARFAGVTTRRAVWLPDRGCVLDLDPAPVETAGPTPVSRDAGAPWPDGNAPVPEGEWGAGVDVAGLGRVIDAAFIGAGDPSAANTRAVAVVHKGRLLVLRTAPGFGPDTPLHGWSMTKTIGGMLMYKLAVGAGLDLNTPVVDAFPSPREPAWVADWRTDDRRTIRLSDLMFMRDGLANMESYNAWGAVPRMLWGVTDAPAFGAGAPLGAPPGTRWRYSSATANVMAAVARGRFESDRAYWRYPRQALFEPIGARTAAIETDIAGNWVASSFGWASVVDWAKLGELLRHDGRWGNEQVLPAGFLKLAQTSSVADGEGRAYGAQTWMAGEPAYGNCKGYGLPEDTLAMGGHWGQIVAVVPSREAVVVRLGWTFKPGQFNTCRFVADVLKALPVS